MTDFKIGSRGRRSSMRISLRIPGALFLLFVLAGCATFPESPEETSAPLNPDNTANLLYELVEKKHQYPQAIELATKLTAQNPSFAPGWYWLGIAYFRENKTDPAISAFKKVTELRPNTPQLASSNEFMGWIYYHRKDFAEALHLFNLALAQKTDLLDSRIGRAHIYLFQGRYDESLEDLQVLIPRLNPVQNQNQLAQVIRAKAFCHLGLGETDQALSSIQKTKEIQNGYDPWEDLALIYYAPGHPNKLNDHGGKVGYLGIQDRNYREGPVKAVEIIEVIKGTPAEKGGLQKGDLILKMDGVPMDDVQAVLQKIMSTPPGTGVLFSVERGKEKKEITIPMGSKLQQINFESDLFIAPLLAKKKIYRHAEQAERNGDYRKAFRLYLETSAKQGLDSDVRKRVMKLYPRIDPPPAIPEEARKRAVFGMTAVKEAKDAKGLDRAIEEYRKAIALAPWWADLYINLAMVQEQRGHFREAAETFKLYLAASPQDPQAQVIQNKIYELEYKAEKR
jgi:tetratricopeptide (TPR) repeat protein